MKDINKCLVVKKQKAIKVKLNKDFIYKLHQLIYDNSNTCIGLEINTECRKFIKRLEDINLVCIN